MKERAMNKRLLVLSIIVANIVLVPQRASAHVLITDNTGSIGAILHVMPDDDPIAGEPSTLFFDIQSQSFSRHRHKVSLAITNDESGTTQVPVKLTGSSVSATYTFPTQGVYKLALTAEAQDAANAHAHTFTHTQRVSRGVAGGALDKPTHAWAEAALVACACSFAILMLVGINRRKEIKTYSKF
jgi:hypothetical protein